MPSEQPKVDASQTRPAEKTPASTQRHHGDLQQMNPPFSYAQAAKGGSPSMPSTSSAGKARSETGEINGKRASSSETRRNSVLDSSKESTKRTASEGRTPEGNEFKVGQGIESTQSGGIKNAAEDAAEAVGQDTGQGNAKVDSTAEKPTVAGQSQPAASTPSSPEYGTTSTSTLPKEDDVFSTANGSSDSTSDKHSQTSQGESKTTEKDDIEKRQNMSASWDEEVPASAPILKEAAPPPVNVWQIRSQNQAKTKISVPTSQPKPTNVANGVGNAHSPIKGSESSSEQKKQDSRKRKPTSGLAEDQTSSGNGKDGIKIPGDTERSKVAAVAPPPPPGDAISWPTPENAVIDGKKKNQDRTEKVERDTSQAPKPHGKEKWVAVPYVPTAVFNTPLPQARRGGRGGARGGRDGEGRGRSNVHTGSSTEKPAVAGANQASTPIGGQDRGRVGATPTPGATTTSKPKRASSAGPITPREQRKPGDMIATEKRKDNEFMASKATVPNNNTNAFRRPSAPTTAKDSQGVQPVIGGQDRASSWTAAFAKSADEDKRFQYDSTETQGQPKAMGPERRNEATVKTPESIRDFQNMPSRERGEPRAERGRGGFRGRGGGNHAFFNGNASNGHGFQNGYPSQVQPPPSPSKGHSNHDRIPQTQYPFSQTHHQPRHHRNNSRSQSIPHSAQYSRFSNGHHGGPPQLANLQTDIANEYGYLPAHQGPMTAMPFTSYGEQPSVFGMVNLQMNYYFSVENLCKDMYLRSHMDSQGFVFLELLAKFNRIKQLTNDMELIRLACHHSQTVEYVNVDGIDRVRARDGWQQWVRKMEERDPSAQNDGPSLQSLSSYPRAYNYGPQPEERSVTSPRSNMMGNPDSAHYQPTNGIVPPPVYNPNVPAPHGLGSPVTKTPLSAAVSEFSPSARSTSSRNFTATDNHAQGTKMFTDAQVDNLHILVRKQLNQTTSIPPPFHSSSSRTFSNGSIDGRSINDELSKFAERQARPLTNGDTPER